MDTLLRFIAPLEITGNTYHLIEVGQSPADLTAFLNWCIGEGIYVWPLIGREHGQPHQEVMVDDLDLNAVTPFITGRTLTIHCPIGFARARLWDGSIWLGRRVKVHESEALTFDKWHRCVRTGHYYVVK